MTTNRRSFFRGLALAPLALFDGPPKRLVMSERFVVWADFSYEAYVWMLESWEKDFPGEPLPQVLEVGNQTDEDAAKRALWEWAEHRPEFKQVRVERRLQQNHAKYERLSDLRAGRQAYQEFDWAVRSA